MICHYYHVRPWEMERLTVRQAMVYLRNLPKTLGHVDDEEKGKAPSVSREECLKASESMMETGAP